MGGGGGRGERKGGRGLAVIFLHFCISSFLQLTMLFIKIVLLLKNKMWSIKILHSSPILSSIVRRNNHESKCLREILVSFIHKSCSRSSTFEIRQSPRRESIIEDTLCIQTTCQDYSQVSTKLHLIPPTYCI